MSNRDAELRSFTKNMIPLRRQHLSYLIFAVIFIPMLLAILIRNAIAYFDYATQFGLILMTLAFPFVAPDRWRTLGFIGRVYGVWLLWGVWRFFFFDIITENDIPGIGYLVAPLLYCPLSVILFFIRKRVMITKSQNEKS